MAFFVVRTRVRKPISSAHPFNREWHCHCPAPPGISRRHQCRPPPPLHLPISQSRLAPTNVSHLPFGDAMRPADPLRGERAGSPSFAHGCVTYPIHPGRGGREPKLIPAHRFAQCPGGLLADKPHDAVIRCASGNSWHIPQAKPPRGVEDGTSQPKGRIAANDCDQVTVQLRQEPIRGAGHRGVFVGIDVMIGRRVRLTERSRTTQRHRNRPRKPLTSPPGNGVAFLRAFRFAAAADGLRGCTGTAPRASRIGAMAASAST